MMSNSTIFFVIIVYCFSPFFSYISAMIKPGCDEDTLILPFTDTNPKPYHTALPDTLVPRHYTLEFQPFLLPNGNSSFAGNAKIAIRCEIQTSVITLHSINMQIFESTISVIKTGDRGKVPVNRVEYNKKKEFVKIHLNRALLPKDEYNVSMKYLGRLNGSRYGFYQSPYRDVNDTRTTWIAVTQFKPTGARWAFPCFDEPHLKATFDIIVVRPSPLKSLSNMPLRHTENRPNGFVADFYSTTKSMSTYLVYFAVSNFTNVTNDQHYKFRIWTRPSAIQYTHELKDVLPRIMEYFENYFKITYVLPQMDVIAIPDMLPDVVENWGLLAMKETLSLYLPLTFHGRHQALFVAIAHGLAHQWFGNLVTMHWWNEVWLNEGFASYFADLGANSHDKGRKILQQHYALHTVVALQKDCLTTTHALSTPISCTSEILKMSDAITHHKGATIIRMMKHSLGADVLYKGLRKYLLNNAYLNTVQDDLWYYLNMASKASQKMNVKEVMDTWTLQKGYPVVTVLRNYNTQTAVVGQQRFIISNKKISRKRKELWHIPLTFTAENDPDFRNTQTKFWLNNKGENVTLKMENGVPSKDQWMIFNIRSVTYCIINYDERNWNLLINALKQARSEDFGYINLAQLIHDSFILARGRHLNHAIPLQLSLNILSKQTVHYLSWKAFDISVKQITYKLKYTEMKAHWNNFLVQIVKPTVHRWNLTGPATHLHTLSQKICLELGVKAGMADTIRHGAELFDKMHKKQMTRYHGVLPTICCAAIRTGGEKEFKLMLNEYLASTWPSDKPRLLSHMSCLTNPAHLNILLDKVLDPNSGVHEFDFKNIFSIVASSVEGKPVAFSFITNKLKLIKTRFADETKSKVKFMLNEVARSFTTSGELQQMKTLIGRVKKELKYEDDFKSTLKTVEANIHWMHDSYEEIKTFLRRHFRF